MKSKLSINRLSLLVCVGILFGFMFSCDFKTNTVADGEDGAASPFPSEEEVISGDTIARCDSSWFPHSQTPAPLEGSKVFLLIQQQQTLFSMNGLSRNFFM